MVCGGSLELAQLLLRLSRSCWIYAVRNVARSNSGHNNPLHRSRGPRGF